MLGNDRFIGYVARRSAELVEVREGRQRAAIAGSGVQATRARRQARSHFTTSRPICCPTRTGRTTRKCATITRADRSVCRRTRTGGSRDRHDDVQRIALEVGAEHVLHACRGARSSTCRMRCRPEFAWSWKSAQFQYDIFKQTTDKRNDAYRVGIHGPHGHRSESYSEHGRRVLHDSLASAARTRTATTAIGARVSW